MVELWRNPTEQQKNKLLDAYGDNIIFGLVAGACKTWQEVEPQMFDEWMYKKWYALTRLFIQNYSVEAAYVSVEDVAADIAEGTWKDFQVPEIQEKKQNYPNKFNGKISILAVAEKFGLKIRGNKCVCPFHNDKDPSLNFYPETNSFHCFGCKTSGDIVKFYQLMKEIKNE